MTLNLLYHSGIKHIMRPRGTYTDPLRLRMLLRLHLCLTLATSFALTPSLAMAQDMMGMGMGMSQGNNPIDIQADEQEFAQDHVVARGKVRVVYGDTTIRAPQATLYRDEAGQPKMAIFTGNPVLIQGQNLIRSHKLTFDIKAAKIIAEGNAHSEVLSNSMNNAAPAGGAGAALGGAPGGGKKKKKVKTDEFGNPDAEPADEPVSEDAETNPEAAGTAAPDAPKKPAAEAKPQKIITDADRQEFERNTGKFEAHGNVRVVAQGINVKSNHLKLVYGTDQKAEAVVFTGDVTAKRDQNVTQADVMTYFLTTQRLQATGHVRSRVVQEKAAGTKKGGLEVDNTLTGGAPAIAASGSTKEEILIISDAQDYNKDSGRIDAEGRVRLYYGNTVGMGPKISMISNEFGQADKVVFIGRSQITQPGRRWIADRITLTVDDRKVLAEGNTRAIIVKNGPAAPKVTPPVVPSPGTDNNSRLVGKGNWQ